MIDFHPTHFSPTDTQQHLLNECLTETNPQSYNMPSTTVTTTSTLAPAQDAKQRKQTEPVSVIAAAKPNTQPDYDHFFWTYTEEPHRTRRQAIIKAHPEVMTLNRPINGITPAY